MSDSRRPARRIVIIGSGFSDLCLGIQLRRELRRSVWAATSGSWYKTADGKITNNGSGTTARYWWETRRPDLGVYQQGQQRHHQGQQRHHQGPQRHAGDRPSR